MEQQRTGFPDLYRYFTNERRALISYKEGAIIYELPYWTFVRLAKEAKAAFKIKHTALVDTGILDAYIDSLGEEEMNRREMSRMAHTRKTDKIEQLMKTGRKRFVRYDEGAQLYSMGLSSFVRLAKEAHAVYRIRRIALVDLTIMDEYMLTFKEE